MTRDANRWALIREERRLDREWEEYARNSNLDAIAERERIDRPKSWSPTRPLTPQEQMQWERERPKREVKKRLMKRYAGKNRQRARMPFEILDYEAIPLDRLRPYLRVEHVYAALTEAIALGLRELRGVKIHPPKEPTP